MENNKNIEVQFEQETRDHVNKVARNLNIVAQDLMNRGLVHDDSKFKDPERSLFIEMTPGLKSLTYGSEEYKKALEKLKPALDFHYKKNDHHLEHFSNKIENMNLIQLTEMVVDWYCASKRHNNGNWEESLLVNKKRYNLNEEIISIIKNTMKFLDNKNKI